MAAERGGDGAGVVLDDLAGALGADAHDALVGGHDAVIGGEGPSAAVAADDAAVLELAGRALRNAGYRVFPATGPRLALEVARAFGDRLDLLVTDVVMPEMTGLQLAAELREAQPDLKVLFVSGYAAEIVDGLDVLDESVEFLEKPFRPSSLLRCVRAVLDGAQLAHVDPGPP